jgi:hypothetical protein
MGAVAFNQEQLAEFYKYAVTFNPESIEKNWDKIKKEIKADRDQVLLTVKIAKSCKTEKEFLKAVQTNELPPIKLSPKEMEMLKGGIIGLIAPCVLVAASFALGYGAGSLLRYMAY